MCYHPQACDWPGLGFFLEFARGTLTEMLDPQASDTFAILSNDPPRLQAGKPCARAFRPFEVGLEKGIREVKGK